MLPGARPCHDRRVLCDSIQHLSLLLPLASPSPPPLSRTLCHVQVQHLSFLLRPSSYPVSPSLPFLTGAYGDIWAEYATTVRVMKWTRRVYEFDERIANELCSFSRGSQENDVIAGMTTMAGFEEVVGTYRQKRVASQDASWKGCQCKLWFHYFDDDAELLYSRVIR